MTTGNSRKVSSITKRGNAIGITLPKRLLSDLGWKESDLIRLDVVRGSLLITKIHLPAVSVLDDAALAGVAR